MAIVNPHLGYAEGNYEPTSFHPQYELLLRDPSWINEVGDAYMNSWYARNYRLMSIVRELYREELRAFIYGPSLDNN
jgi:hypothetical protein